MDNISIIDRLSAGYGLSLSQWENLLGTFSDRDLDHARLLARSVSTQHFNNKIYLRGLIEFSNRCKNNCYYCGIRRDNKKAPRYRLSEEEILNSCELGYKEGIRTFVLQSGEDSYYNDEKLCHLVSSIKTLHPDCAVTLSVGEKKKTSYENYYRSGASRYLLRHEAFDPSLYSALHPAELSISNRLKCLDDLKEIGFQTGCGMMIGAPHQTSLHLAYDMDFLFRFKPEMIGLGPFIPHSQTPFADKPVGSTKLTLFIMALTRIMLPKSLIPATTALATTASNGRQLGILAGCNVIMANISPSANRAKYSLYNNKAGNELSPENEIETIKSQMSEIGYKIITDIGDYQKEDK